MLGRPAGRMGCLIYLAATPFLLWHHRGCSLHLYLFLSYFSAWGAFPPPRTTTLQLPPVTT